MNILIMEGPGAGESTMPARIVGKFNASHISTRDIFRNEVGEGIALGMEAKSFMDRGLLVPDEVVNNMIKSHLERLEGKKNGFLLDGYPRILDQAKAFDALAEDNKFAIDKVIAFEINPEKLVDRVTGHRICKECGEIHHIKSKPSKVDDVCDVCDEESFQRENDTVESLAAYLEECSSQMAPVFDHYDSEGIVTRTDASQPIDSIWNDILAALEKQERWKPKQVRS